MKRVQWNHQKKGVRKGNLIRIWGGPEYHEIQPDDSLFPINLHPKLVAIEEDKAA